MRKEYKQMMDQLSPREELVEQVLAQAGAHAEQKQNRRRPMHKKKLILALAAALVVLTGSAMAVGSQLGLLNVFFQGDTSGLFPGGHQRPGALRPDGPGQRGERGLPFYRQQRLLRRHDRLCHCHRRGAE